MNKYFEIFIVGISDVSYCTTVDCSKDRLATYKSFKISMKYIFGFNVSEDLKLLGKVNKIKVHLKSVYISIFH